ncbi:transcriptional regulator [Streptomyces anthocyanicus]|uniref:helix-turn-helix domain-containing protein n=1 Tax=Streptomyces TaxID=1883 RepID=UPI00177ACE12|nr:MULTISPECIES: helix-turn-helix transcriptional regulator [Streptomyces]MDX3369899.1 helix-turn-helix domain-containing protein [Streptomyces sp. ME02-6987-2C]MDX3426490.1 helix-turn-helix domain-containing protein [Streptomyces sp. ME02-6985-2c]GHA48583.1 transcriptional regulator [Streptomyces anthocyanicus]GHC34871.1 transcriptional regulator [Streptomyces anthocyanicus]
MAGDDFAALLRELKERSGLSYGALGKRLHMSGSTLHRYVSGEVVPVEFAPVERLARVCRATPDELLELHRRWIRADALRGVKKDEAEGAEGSDGGETAEGAEGAAADSTTSARAPSAAPPVPDTTPVPATPVPAAPVMATPVPVTPDATPAPGSVPPARDASGPARRRVPRAALYAATGVVAVSAAVALVANLVASPDDDGRHGPAGAVAQTSASVSGTATGPGSTSPSPSASTSAPSASASVSGTSSASPSRPATAAPSRRAPAGPPLTVSTTPYYWEVPCDHAFLVDRSPKNVPKPPPQQGAVGWAAPLKAVSANRQEVVLTVQGTGPETVVLEDLHVRVVSSGPALDWNQYVMGNGCGGQVDTASFDVSLDLGTPTAVPIGGQRDFPYSVTESDTEVFHATAHTSGQDVSWYLELEWSSGGRHGMTRVDDHGKPFRTSASRDDSYYAYPLGSDHWEPVEGG